MMPSPTLLPQAREDNKAFHDLVLGSHGPAIHLGAGRSQQTTRAMVLKMRAVLSLASAGVLRSLEVMSSRADAKPAGSKPGEGLHRRSMLKLCGGSLNNSPPKIAHVSLSVRGSS